MRCGTCATNLEHADQGAWCQTCFKVKYCSTECEVKDSPQHQTLCTLVEHLKANIPGFNHRLFVRNGRDPSAFLPSHEAYRELLAYGQKQLEKTPGAICYTTHPAQKLAEIQARAKANDLVILDPLHQLVLHIFSVNISCLKKILNNYDTAARKLFLTTCRRPQLVSTLGVPAVYFRDFWSQGERDICISVFLITPSEC